MTTFALNTDSPAFDPQRPIAVNNFLFMPAGRLSVVDQRPVPKRPARAKELARG